MRRNNRNYGENSCSPANGRHHSQTYRVRFYAAQYHEPRHRAGRAVDLRTYAPVHHTETQQRTHLEASLSFEELTDETGNSILHFTIRNLPPYATKIITIRADLLLSDTSLPGESESAKPSLSDLSPQPYCESDDPEIRQLARQLQTGDPLRTAEQIFRWVAEHIEYSGYLKYPRGARYALTHKQGDCTEYIRAVCRSA